MDLVRICAVCLNLQASTHDSVSQPSAEENLQNDAEPIMHEFKESFRSVENKLFGIHSVFANVKNTLCAMEGSSPNAWKKDVSGSEKSVMLTCDR